MRKLCLALGMLLFGSVGAFAQAMVILPGGCGTGSFPNSIPYLTVDSTGRLCNSTTATISGGTQSNASSGVATTSTNVPTNSYMFDWNGITWDQALGILAGTVGAPGTDVLSVQSPITPGSAGFPAASTPITGNGAGTTGAVVGTLAANATKTTYICGFNVSAVGTLAVGPIVIAGLITGSMTYQLTATATGNTLAVPFTPCIPASAINTAITTTTTADGSASAVDVNSWGFQQ